jgi:hypothetical protein
LEKRIIKEEEEKVQRLVSEGSREIMGGEMSSYRLKMGLVSTWQIIHQIFSNILGYFQILFFILL